jgi:sirohydrochlorin ferrochelatase
MIIENPNHAPEALLIAHGSPADPIPQESVMQALAVRVAMWLPGWRIRGTTLALPGAVEGALATLRAPMIYPFFMAEGFFTRVNLPRRLREAGYPDLTQLLPFGADPDLPTLMANAALRAAANAGIDPATTGLLIAGHGSKVSKTSTQTTWAMVEDLKRLTPFNPITAGFVEEEPFLPDAARAMKRGICLPFFALRAGHVMDDLPDAMAQSHFDGPLLAPIGEDIGTPRLIANALNRALTSKRPL